MAPLFAGTSSQALAQAADAGGAASGVSLGRRRLGSLEVSSVGIGVQNMSRTYQTTIPTRAEMHNIIRTAFDHGVTFFDAAEAYGPHEVERILGKGVAPFRDQVGIIVLLPELFIDSTRVSRRSSTNGPFLLERLMA